MRVHARLRFILTTNLPSFITLIRCFIGRSKPLGRHEEFGQAVFHKKVKIQRSPGTPSIFEVSGSVMEAMMLDRIVEVFCEVDDFCQAFLPHWEASLLSPGGPAPRVSPSEIITLLLTVQASNISRASITASPSRWLLSWHALLRALRHPAEKRLRAAGVLPDQPSGEKDRDLLHRLHRPATPIALTGICRS